ncbi:MAG: hypothetical protein KA715_03155 [Xanthomonadaceae bacterium]|nr:hypothetical protein [Xanthomonadaceae bacterium]
MKKIALILISLTSFSTAFAADTVTTCKKDYLSGDETKYQELIDNTIKESADAGYSEIISVTSVGWGTNGIRTLVCVIAKK